MQVVDTAAGIRPETGQQATTMGSAAKAGEEIRARHSLHTHRHPGSLERMSKMRSVGNVAAAAGVLVIVGASEQVFLSEFSDDHTNWVAP